jgi:hypothetical protein
MTGFEAISPEGFLGAIASRGSRALRRQFARSTFADIDSWLETEAVLHDGPLTMGGRFSPPAFNTLILGDVLVEGLCDCSTGGDMGGLFVVIGKLECDMFANHLAAGVFIDGDLEVPGLLLNAFEDSALTVIGDLRTHFYYGWDMAAEVGGRIEMTYGDGYCLPLGYGDPRREAVYPRHDRQTSRLLLDVPTSRTDHDISEELHALLEDGASPFRRRSGQA